MKKTWVISLGGSLIVPEKVEPQWLASFKKTILKNTKKNKFIIVCGGGFVAREYIEILAFEHKSKKEQSLAGIDATRMNAKVMIEIFGRQANQQIPKNMGEVVSALQKNEVVFCGGLRYAPNQTSDGTAARLAAYCKSPFINLTDVDGLYSANPKKDKNAKFISLESWTDFEHRAKKMLYKPGQHFVLDQSAATLIKKEKIATYILGKNLKNLDLLLKGKAFRGTTIQN
jgi:uridylate kinase